VDEDELPSQERRRASSSAAGNKPQRAGSASGGDSARKKIALDKSVPFRASKLWDIQRLVAYCKHSVDMFNGNTTDCMPCCCNRAFYEQAGVECWQNSTVPCFVTSNAFIAHQTAR
jgi:hypothetical protein